MDQEGKGRRLDEYNLLGTSIVVLSFNSRRSRRDRSIEPFLGLHIWLVQ